MRKRYRLTLMSLKMNRSFWTRSLKTKSRRDMKHMRGETKDLETLIAELRNESNPQKTEGP